MPELNSFFKLIDLPGIEDLGMQAAETAGETATATAANLAGNPMILVTAVILVIATIAIVFFLKKIIINSVLGIICWALVKFVLAIEFPLIPSLVVSVVFGPAGIGVMLLLRFLGLM